uniref:Uncharacterized protein n=1 Tax=Polysiphonia sp. TaxID=1967842 RepID=A0A1Z1MUF5_9FLOR|nr:hypothetical protein [Polysiphonia sp.]
MDIFQDILVHELKHISFHLLNLTQYFIHIIFLQFAYQMLLVIVLFFSYSSFHVSTFKVFWHDSSFFKPFTYPI